MLLGHLMSQKLHGKAICNAWNTETTETIKPVGVSDHVQWNIPLFTFSAEVCRIYYAVGNETFGSDSHT